ncbi:MAG: hypothetical protein IAE89_07360 [Anaerolineae bacterium]|nr:hypothetical protein [Anaerolineae bacterium]
MSDYFEPTSPVDDAMERAIAVQKKYETLLLAVPGVIGVGVGNIHIEDRDEDEIGVIVMVDPAAKPITGEAAQAVANLPGQLDGVAVQIQEIGPFTAL